MADPDTLQNLHSLHNMYAKEHLKMVNNLPRMAQKVSDLISAASAAAGSNDPADLSVYDQSVESITTSTSVLRKLDIFVQTMLDLPAARPTLSSSEAKPLMSKSAPIIEPENRDEKKLIVPDFSFYLRTYHIGYTSVAILTHIASALGNFVYLFDVHLGSHIGMSLNMTECQPLTQTPTTGIFGVHLDEDGLFRAVRAYSCATAPRTQHDAATTTELDTIAAYLLDTGETVNIDLGAKTSPRLYALSEQQQIVPATAIPCRVVRVQHIPSSIASSEFVQMHLYQKVRFEVVEIHADNTVDVYLSPMSYQPPSKSTNPFYDMIAEQESASTHALEQTSSPIFDVKPPTMTSMEDVLEINSEDACIARNIDQTTAVKPQSQTIVAQKWPQIGETLSCVPTHITAVNTFFAQIVHKMVPAELQLGELTRRMNTAESLSALRRFDQRPPNGNDLVLALYRDRLWHRARVLGEREESMNGRLNVFFVDYGNCYQVGLDDVRQWEERFAHMPFQAFEFRIANVEEAYDNLDVQLI